MTCVPAINDGPVDDGIEGNGIPETDGEKEIICTV